MAVREILRLGHPALRSAADLVPVEELSGEPLRTLVEDLVETMRAAPGIGLAAPQVGVGLQLFVYEVAADEGSDPVPLQVVVNPMVEPESHELVVDWEGCLSIPGLRGLVPRYAAVRLQGLDGTGAKVDRVVEGLEARIVQHEFDHLNGVVFLDHMGDLRSLAYEEELERYLGESAVTEPPPTG